MSKANETKATGIKGLTCPKCQEEGCMHLNLDDATLFYCTSCGDEVNREEIETMIESAQKWIKTLAWIDTMPNSD